LKSRNTALQDKDEQVKKLEESLAELVKSKIDYENQLLEKFSLLLNEKKLKIRDQQRLLASSNVDPARLEAVEESRAVSGHSAGPSRKGKRKAGPVPDQSDSESGEGFEKMEVDEASNESEQEQAQTADESTADEADSEDEAPSPPTRKPEKKNGEGSSAANASSSRAPRKEDTAPPPKRDLPFGKKPAPPAAKAAPVLEGSETESDDEL
jgi:hypothetical protein